MKQERGTPRYAHTEGYTDLCFSDGGGYIITCGSEGDVRIWKDIEDDDPQANCVGETAFAIAQKGDKLYVGSDHNYVQVFSFPESELDRILTRFTAAVNTLDISHDGNFVAAGSSDMKIHLVDVTTSVIKFFDGHKAPILHVTIDPKLEFLGSSSCDGSVCMWRISDQKMVKEWPNVIKTSNSFHMSESRCKLSWEPLTGRLFAIPFGTEIKIMQRGTWNIIMTLSNNQCKNYSLTSWSSCGRYLAATTVTGDISIWNTLTSTLLSSSSDASSTDICALSWHPQKDIGQLCYCDIKGQLVMVDLNSYPQSSVNLIGKTSAETENYEQRQNEEAAITMDDDDDEDLDAISLAKIKYKYNCSANDAPEIDDNDDADSIKSSSSVNARPAIQSVELQLAFQPTSMPVHLQRRFMVFNDIGYVKHINTEEENVIDVDFHDASIHHAFRINNLLNHIIAALNTETLALACEKTEESSSKLVCRLLKSWDSSKEWTIELDDNESIEAIAVGIKWVAACTNLRFLRLFSLSGVQREVLCIPGPVLCMNSSEDLLMVVYHCASGLPGEQNLSFAVYQIMHDVKVLVAAQPLPLSSKSTLKWVGFSDAQNPCVVDSDGVLKLFSSSCGLWKPICLINSLKKDESTRHFVIGVSEERQNIRCIPCKGSFYPSITPHPFITEISWQIPLCELNVDKGTLEEQLWRCSIAKECLSKEDKNLHKEFLATALRLFALCVKCGREMRVYDICDMMNSLEVSQLASKYASKMNNSLLVDKLTLLRDEQKNLLDDFQSKAASNSSHYPRADSMESYGHATANEQSQELFTDTTCLYSSSQHLSVSLIAETKEKINSIEQRVVLPSRKINPFKKSSQAPLSEHSASTTQPTDSSVKTETGSKMEDNLNLPFIHWFKLHKDELMQEHPHTDSMELAKFSISKYKSMKTAAKAISSQNKFEQKENETNQINNGHTDTDVNKNRNKKRRKVSEDEELNVVNDDTPTVAKKNPFEKLKGFAFQSKS